MIDDFAPKKPTPQGSPKKPEQLTGFRPSSNLPEHSGDDLMPQYSSRRETTTPQTSTTPITTAPSTTPTNDISGNGDLQMPSKKKRSKKKKLFILLFIVILLGAAGYTAWYLGFKDSGTPVSNTSNADVVEVVEEEEEEELPPTKMAPLSGVDVAPELADRPVTAVMIENSGEARPQSGLLEADMVFEAIAEGGITRFLALYQNSQPSIIGPIRSARPYYVEWAATFDASYVHAGGSPDGQARIQQLGVKDVSAFSDSEIFYRTDTRFAPHNLYTSMSGLDQINQRNGFTTSTFTPWLRKKDVPQSANATTVNIDISSQFYNVSYTYAPETNSYQRILGGTPHLDEPTGKQLSPKSVITMAFPWSQNGIYSVYNMTGSGSMLVFQDGRVIEGTWSRSGATDQFVFTDKYGFPLLLNKGQTWVTAVTNIAEVTFN